MEQSGRRRFLKSITVLGAAATPAAVIAADKLSQHSIGARHTESGAARIGSEVYHYLTPPEVAFVEAAISHLIPADELGPGAKEAGVAHFIDQQLTDAWGAHARNYRQGPWSEGTPTQGYQSPLTPQEVYRTAIAETDRNCNARYGKTFAALEPTQQEEVLRALQAGEVALEMVPARLFFNMLWGNTQEGFFADPMYGGNRDKVGWKLVGFPGVAAAYTDLVEKHNRPYHVVPVSIPDVQQRLVRVDDHGHPVHVLLGEKD